MNIVCEFEKNRDGGVRLTSGSASTYACLEGCMFALVFSGAVGIANDEEQFSEYSSWLSCESQIVVESAISRF